MRVFTVLITIGCNFRRSLKNYIHRVKSLLKLSKLSFNCKSLLFKWKNNIKFEPCGFHSFTESLLILLLYWDAMLQKWIELTCYSELLVNSALKCIAIIRICWFITLALWRVCWEFRWYKWHFTYVFRINIFTSTIFRRIGNFLIRGNMLLCIS